MLSYRHSFHAGNFADVLKHLIQVEVLTYLARKDKPYMYIDTHSAAGLYSLSSDEATKNHEYHTGIGALGEQALKQLAPSIGDDLKVYLSAVSACRKAYGDDIYPGSPWFAMHLMRECDRALMFELHPQDLTRLEALTRRNRRIRVRGEDGFQGLIASVPPAIRRGLILMDPPYEIKTDYQKTVKTLVDAHHRFSTATYALWYPVVERRRINELESSFYRSGMQNIQLFELGIQSDTEGRGMTASGMILINPPYTLKPMMDSLLPTLSAHLAMSSGYSNGSAKGHWRSEVLVGE